MKVRALEAAEQGAWDALAGARPESGFMQSWAWSNFKKLEGYEVLQAPSGKAGGRGECLHFGLGDRRRGAFIDHFQCFDFHNRNMILRNRDTQII